MSQAAISDLTHTMTDELNAFSFWVGDSLFAVNLDNVLSVEQDNSSIQPDPFQGRGALGIVKHRGVPVRVFDFAEFLGVDSSGSQKEHLIRTLGELEQEHIDWMSALERALAGDESFTASRDPQHSAFSRWRNEFQTRDDELISIMKQLDEPHKRMYALADQLLTMKVRGRADDALQQLEIERSTTLAQLRRLFGRARDQVRDSIKSVMLFITIDGKEPRLALRLNEISDMVGFSLDRVTRTDALGVSNDERLAAVFAGYLDTGDDNDCLLIDVDGLLAAILQP